MGDDTTYGAWEQAQSGEDLVKMLSNRPFRHDHSSSCPGCGDNLMSEGVTRIAYIHETCECDLFEFPHLIEQLWHIACLRDAATEITERRLLRDCQSALKPGRYYTRAAKDQLVERIIKTLDRS